EGVQRVVEVSQLRAGSLNPRKEFREDELTELADSIRQKGLVQPLIVRAHSEGGYEIVAGERRWRAAQRAGLHMLPVIVRELSDQEVLELAIIENVQRTDLNAIEEAGGYRELMDRFGYTQDRLSEVIGKSRSHLANTLRLLKLPASIQAMVQEGQLTAGHARPLVGRDDAEELAQKIVEKDLNVREVEALVQATDLAQEHMPQIRRVKDKDADTRAFEIEVSQALGLRVEVKKGAGETGTLSIRYANYEQLDHIKAKLTGQQ
ncbi:MAG: ParB/RepB/Spo0J family partition protein, partial [Hyphomicrobiaceae bacterium]|nr:ParB/RepB/Spo0J family partition protein [Hyphomicrobiaceae bacterium]